MMNALSPDVLCRDAALTFGTGPTAVVAVHGATCAVHRGDRIAIIGPSGSGKSTLLHLLAGLERPTSGTIEWPALTGAHDAATRSAAIGLVFQTPSLIPTLSVEENVALPLQLAGVAAAPTSERTSESLAQVDAAHLADKLPEELSGGQAQRVAVARVLAMRPPLILADEPTGQLDHASGQLVVNALLAAADHIGAALVVTTHDATVSARLPDHWTMHEGRLSVPDRAGVNR
ncbi:putative ABC transport system ATP-binding protein [Phycicoccus badiiscoriae]|uniref:Putative ABC transport system ATP-binding protein n=1 Tax=Pedococcus badiiscoriae TaxID=642776 RepID=A0A852WF03_9MICO|nr:ATP-binding cassette domain-containing protein [Pedococcus badiiscoriae]NYG07340.1 putative ABC transport system ATP-binding protein [Pedococcus badiiscoriae]